MKIHVLVRQRVEDYERWKAVFDAQAEARKAAGSSHGHIFRDINDPSMVSLLTEFESMDKLRAFFQSDATKKAMEEAGVIGTPEQYLLDEVEKYRD